MGINPRIYSRIGENELFRNISTDSKVDIDLQDQTSSSPCSTFVNFIPLVSNAGSSFLGHSACAANVVF
jgi:hypothetical protein